MNVEIVEWSNVLWRFACGDVWIVNIIGGAALYLLGISPTHFASFPHPFASFPHQICFVSPKNCFISPTVCCISPTKCFISPTVSCISLCNVVSRCQKIFYQIFFLIFAAKCYFKCVKWAPYINPTPHHHHHHMNVWILPLMFLHYFTLFAIDMHQYRSISLFQYHLTTFTFTPLPDSNATLSRFLVLRRWIRTALTAFDRRKKCSGKKEFDQFRCSNKCLFDEMGWAGLMVGWCSQQG